MPNITVNVAKTLVRSRNSPTVAELIRTLGKRSPPNSRWK